ncbi:phosphosulfolactate phosphohydrolase [Leucobacter allii]|uniref:Phosphosulfolactate phosphohydrolase n=1 Tax=Leucobacter allii TaxID=2932247 RepID=A0ABY4FIY9_9MICO|nr:phosphosulfolactate phosphohydrolase [Leucobacter allii]UOQ55904.1 phosphosulfolactate phosphohydrolase [Leucobacter allii]
MRSQASYQVRLGWGSAALERLAESGIVVVVDAIEDPVGSAAAAGDAGPAAETDGAAPTSAADSLARRAAASPHAPAVFRASLRNATATARAVYAEQLARGGRTAINLVLVGEPDERTGTGTGTGTGGGAAARDTAAVAGGFAVEDYLAAGAIGDALSALGIDHTSPDLAVATEGFRPLTRALKHLVSASAAGLALAAADGRDAVHAAAALDADDDAHRVA